MNRGRVVARESQHLRACQYTIMYAILNITHCVLDTELVQDLGERLSEPFAQMGLGHSRQQVSLLFQR